MSNTTKSTATNFTRGGVTLRVIDGGFKNSDSAVKQEEFKLEEQVVEKEAIQSTEIPADTSNGNSFKVIFGMLAKIAMNYAVEHSYVLKKLLVKALVAAGIIYLMANDITLVVFLAVARFALNKPIKSLKLLGAGVATNAAMGFAKIIKRL